MIIRRVCPEHVVRLFNELRIMDRVFSGELELRTDPPRAKGKPWKDHQGKLLMHNEISQVLDHRFPTTDPRHIAAKTHRHLDAAGEPGASGKYDPKSVTTENGIKYQRMPPAGPCELCETDGMIPPDERFRDSTYAPPAVPPK